MSLIDTHCHIDLYPNPHSIAQQIDREKIITIVVSNLPSHFEILYSETGRYRYIRPALGLHPLMADEHSAKEFNLFKSLLIKTSYIGETGLDYSSAGKATFQKQIESFRFVLKAIRDRPRFISIHSRGAEEKVLELLDEYKITSAVFHWFTGTAMILEKVIKAGYYCSINPAMVRSKKGRSLIEMLPRDKVLTESDGPHIILGNNPITPSNVWEVISFLQRLWKVTNPKVVEQIFANFMDITKPIRSVRN